MAGASLRRTDELTQVRDFTIILFSRNARDSLTCASIAAGRNDEDGREAGSRGRERL